METTLTLDQLVAEYLADKDFLREREDVAKRRLASIPRLQIPIHAFIRGDITIKEFCPQLEKTLRAEEDWGATGFGFMMELNKFSKYHNDANSDAGERFREILDILNTSTLGMCIEDFYNFLLTERDRLRRDGKSSGMIVPASRSAFIMSLFAYWLDPDGYPIIYYDSMRKALKMMMQENMVIFSAKKFSRLDTNIINITREDHHKEAVNLIHYIWQNYPELHANSFVQSPTNAFWFEFFCRWVHDRYIAPSAQVPPSTLVREIDNPDILTSPPGIPPVIHDEPHRYVTPIPEITEPQNGTKPRVDNPNLINHDQLKPTPEPLLTQLIHKVQRYILIEEDVIRRVYHALLAGHVILAGPPGTGKTELARLIPEILWQSAKNDTAQDENGSEQAENGEIALADLTTETAYTTRLVTATDDWTARTLISGLMPQNRDGNITYKIQYGHLTAAILKNWSSQDERDHPEVWSTLTLRRTRVTTTGGIERGTMQTFRGVWLVIDEFNRAPIDLALGEAMTALGGNDVLRVGIESGSAELPIPQDFRIIGTLNSFDRHYLNQISEALKRRFSFIEILPPARAQREAEQGIVLYKALQKIKHLSETIDARDENILYWNGITIGAELSGQYSVLWDDDQSSFRQTFEAAWRIFEVIRIYRQLGTAQAINLVRHMLIAGILRGYETRQEWIERALDAALCDTIADQLQVLLPDEIDVLLLYLTTEPAQFPETYNSLLLRLASTPQRLYGQLLALSSVTNEQGELYLTDEDVERIASLDVPMVDAAILNGLFRLPFERCRLPQFVRRLRMFKAERGL